VTWKTDLRNIPSQKTAEKCCAVKEGVLRSQFITRDGTRRDSVYYSWIDLEWNASTDSVASVKTRIEGKIKSFVPKGKQK